MVIVIYFDDPEKMGYPFNKPHYFESYQVFAALCKQKNVALYFAKGKDSYLGNMQFKNGYFFQDEKLTFRSTSFTADIIYLKGYDIAVGKNDTVLNNPALTHICHDKYVTYKQFGKYMATTYEINKSNYKDILLKIKSEKIVLKPQFGSEGEGIVIVEKKDFVSTMIDFTKPYFVQEFLDSSGGIPRLVIGMHDLRLILFNGKVKGSFIRQPKKGSMLANLAQGGSFVYVPINKIPSSALAIAKYIDKKFVAYTPRLYAIDLMYQKNKPYLVELNDQPGMPYMMENKDENAATRFHHDLLALLT